MQDHRDARWSEVVDYIQDNRSARWTMKFVDLLHMCIIYYQYITGSPIHLSWVPSQLAPQLEEKSLYPIRIPGIFHLVFWNCLCFRSTIACKIAAVLSCAIAFAGMMFGAVLWGNLADKIGRRITLMTALLVNGVFGLVSAFVPTYWLFLLCRLVSGIGIGGSIPIIFAYFAEFCPLSGRGKKLGFLLLFWVLGGTYVAGLGWLIIPQTDLQFTITDTYVFGSWRVFMVICTVPIILSMLCLLIMPESPRFLLQVGRDLDSLAVYRKIYMWNHTEPGAEYEMPEIQLPNRTGLRETADCHQQGALAELARGLENFWNSLFQLFYPPLSIITVVLCFTWFSLSFGYYGLTIWFPEYIKKLEQETFYDERTMLSNLTVVNEIFTNSLDNIYYYNSTFVNVVFHDMSLRHVIFDMCMLQQTTFSNVTAEQSYFVESRLYKSTFNVTNFYPSKFQGTLFRNTTFDNMIQGCQVDFDSNYSTHQVFLENFLGQVAVIPGTILTALLVDKVGRVKIIAVSLFLAGVSVFFIWFTNTEMAVVGMNCVFNFVVMGAWNGVDIISTELYPTQLRSTAFGFLSCLGRIAAILGNVTFGNFISVSKAIPILVTAGIMAAGGALSFKLPESKDRLI